MKSDEKKGVFMYLMQCIAHKHNDPLVCFITFHLVGWVAFFPVMWRESVCGGFLQFFFVDYFEDKYNQPMKP